MKKEALELQERKRTDAADIDISLDDMPAHPVISPDAAMKERILERNDKLEQLKRATSSSEQEAHSSYDAVLLADRSFQNIGKMVVPSLRRLPPEQREQLTSMLVHTLGQIQGEVSRCL